MACVWKWNWLAHVTVLHTGSQRVCQMGGGSGGLFFRRVGEGGCVCGGVHTDRGEARNVTLHRQRNSCTVRGGKWDKADAIKEQEEVAETQTSVKEPLLSGLQANRSLLHLSKHPSHLWGARMENMLLQGINSAHHCEHSVEIDVCEVGLRFAKFKYSHQKNKRSHKHQADFKDFVIYPLSSSTTWKIITITSSSTLFRGLVVLFINEVTCCLLQRWRLTVFSSLTINT